MKPDIAQDISDMIKVNLTNLGFTSYKTEKIAFNLNIIIVRSDKPIGKYPDFMYITYRDQKLDWRIDQFECCCPRTLASDEYLSTYKIGNYKEPTSKHSQMALVQRLGKVKQTVTNKEGFLGYHIVNNKAREGNNLIKLSSPVFYKEFLKLCHAHNEANGNSFDLVVI